MWWLDFRLTFSMHRFLRMRRAMLHSAQTTTHTSHRASAYRRSFAFAIMHAVARVRAGPIIIPFLSL